MIQRLVGICFVLGLTAAAPLRKGAYAPALPGSRPPCAAKSLTFCEEVDKYPAKLIQTLLQLKSFAVDDFFNDESEGLEEPPPEYTLHQEMTPELTTEGKKRNARNADTTFESDRFSELCPVQNKTAAPRLASNSKGEWRFIAQDEMTKLQQKFRVQLCNDSEKCQKSCIQFYSAVPMLSIDPSGGSVSKDIFWMPSSCRCFDDSDNAV